VVLDVGLKGDGRRRQVTQTCETLTSARQFVDQTRADVKRGIYTAPDALTFGGLADRWLESRRDVREVTRYGYEQALKTVRGRWGGRKAQSLTRADVEALVSWLAVEGGQRGKGLRQRSVVYVLGTVRQVLGHGVAEGLLPTNVAVGVKAPRRQRADTRPTVVWEPTELLAFRDVADTDTWAAGWRLTLCGLRRSEVLGLTWEHADLDAGTVTVRQGRVLLDGHRTAVDDPKSAASWRTVPVESMHPGTVALLRSLKARQAADRLAAGTAYDDTGGYLLADALGTPVRPEAYSDRFGELCRQAQVPTVWLHSTRHTLALQMHRAGVAPADAAALLGHTVAVHLASYVPRTERGAQSAATALGGVLAAAR